MLRRSRAVQIDLTSTAPFADVPTLEQDKTLKVLKQPGMNCRFIALNHRKPPFDDVHFRRAVSMAFDRNAMVKVVLFGEGVPSHGLIPPSLAYAYETKPRETALFNAERAKAELAKSKYANGFGDIPVLAWGSSWWKRTVEVLALQVNQTLGTKLAVEVTEANTGLCTPEIGRFPGQRMGLARAGRCRRVCRRNPQHQGLAQLPGLQQPQARRSSAPAGAHRAGFEEARRHLQTGREHRDRGSGRAALFLLEYPQPDDDPGYKGLHSAAVLQLRRPVRRDQDGMTPPRLSCR